MEFISLFFLIEIVPSAAFTILYLPFNANNKQVDRQTLGVHTLSPFGYSLTWLHGSQLLLCKKKKSNSLYNEISWLTLQSGRNLDQHCQVPPGTQGGSKNRKSWESASTNLWSPPVPPYLYPSLLVHSRDYKGILLVTHPPPPPPPPPKVSNQTNGMQKMRQKTEFLSGPPPRSRRGGRDILCALWWWWWCSHSRSSFISCSSPLIEMRMGGSFIQFDHVHGPSRSQACENVCDGTWSRKKAKVSLNLTSFGTRSWPRLALVVGVVGWEQELVVRPWRR